MTGKLELGGKKGFDIINLTTEYMNVTDRYTDRDRTSAV